MMGFQWGNCYVLLSWDRFKNSWVARLSWNCSQTAHQSKCHYSSIHSLGRCVFNYICSHDVWLFHDIFCAFPISFTPLWWKGNPMLLKKQVRIMFGVKLSTRNVGISIQRGSTVSGSAPAKNWRKTFVVECVRNAAFSRIDLHIITRNRIKVSAFDWQVTWRLWHVISLLTSK